MMLGLGLSLIFAVLSWKDSTFVSILALIASVIFFFTRSEREKTLFHVSLIFLLVLEGFEYLKGTNYDRAELFLVLSFFPLVVTGFAKKKAVNIPLKSLFWFLVAMALWKVASIKYPTASYLVFPVVALVFIRDLFGREKDGRKVFAVTDEGSLDGGSEVQKMAGSGTGSDEGVRRTGNDSEGSDRENKEQR